MDAISLGDWLLRFGKSSLLVRERLAEMAEWLANDSPPWAAYRALMTGRIVALDKCPGVRPVGVGETFFRLMAKCVLLVAGDDATAACGVHQLCGGLEAGIEGGIHAMRRQWEAVQDESEPWAALLVDAKNAFNEVHRTSLMWHVRHRWPAGARFAFNSYRHSRALVLRGYEGLLDSREGVTQGDPLAMVLYAIALLPLIHKLQSWLQRERELEVQLAAAYDGRDDDCDGSLIEAFKAMDMTDTSISTIAADDEPNLPHLPNQTSGALYDGIWESIGGETPSAALQSEDEIDWHPQQYWYADDSSLVAQWWVIREWFSIL